MEPKLTTGVPMIRTCISLVGVDNPMSENSRVVNVLRDEGEPAAADFRAVAKFCGVFRNQRRATTARKW